MMEENEAENFRKWAEKGKKLNIEIFKFFFLILFSFLFHVFSMMP